MGTEILPQKVLSVPLTHGEKESTNSLNNVSGFQIRCYDHTQAKESVINFGRLAKNYSDVGRVLFIGCNVSNKSVFIMSIYLQDPPSILFHPHKDTPYSNPNRQTLHEEAVDTLQNFEELLEIFFRSARESGATGYNTPRNGWQSPTSSEEMLYVPRQTNDNKAHTTQENKSAATLKPQTPRSAKPTNTPDYSGANRYAHHKNGSQPSKPGIIIGWDEDYESDGEEDFQDTKQHQAPKSVPIQTSQTDVEKNEGVHSQDTKQHQDTKQQQAPKFEPIQTPSEPTNPHEAAMLKAMMDPLNGGAGAG